MSLFEVGECRVCGKNCLWIPMVDGILAVFEVCSDECLEKDEEAQEILSKAKAEMEIK